MMKKLYILISLFASSSLFALPSGNLYETNTGYGVGFYGDYIYNRYMQIDRSDEHSKVTKTYIKTNAAYFSSSRFDRLNLFTTLGATNLNLTVNNNLFGRSVRRSEYTFLKSESAFSYSVGMRAIALQFTNMAFGVEASYFSTNPKINSSTDPRTIDIDYLDGNQHMKYTDWQVCAVQSSRFPFSKTTALFAHIAAKYNQAAINMGNETLFLSSGNYNLFNLTNSRSFGIALGLTLAENDKWSLAAEERLIDEKALCITGMLRF